MIAVLRVAAPTRMTHLQRGHVVCVAGSFMHDDHPSRTFRTDNDIRRGRRQERRDGAEAEAAAELGAYGYASQGYPIYGQLRGASPYDDPEPGWFADPASSAYAFGYTTSVRSNNPFPSSGYGGHAGKGPKDYVRADSRVLEDVCERLASDDEVDASEISVSVQAGEVTLDGSVVDRHTRRRAEHLAAGVRGVVDVHVHLRVRKGLLRELGDKLAGEGTEEHHGHHGEGPRSPASSA